MKISLIIILNLWFTMKCNAQQVDIVLKDGAKISQEIKGHSETQLFLDNKTINYSEIESLKFDSEESINKSLRDRLASTEIKVYIKKIVQHVNNGYLNNKPEKGDKKIILVCSDSLEVLYKRIGQYLSVKGYAIENSNKDFLTIKTALRATSKLNYNYILNIVVINNTINISAQWKLNSSLLAGTQESGFFDWEYTSDKEGTFTMTVNSVLFNDLIRNLSDFERLQIRYE